MSGDNKNIFPIGKIGKGSRPDPVAQQITVSVTELDFAICPCGGTVFQQGFQVGKLSKLHAKNTSGQDQLIPAGPIWVCVLCGSNIEPEFFESKPDEDGN